MPRYFRAPPRIPTRAAVLRVTDSDAHVRDHLLVAVAAGTGLRVHELVALDWEQLVTEARAARHRVRLSAEDTKGNIGGDVVLNEALRWKVARYRTWCARRGLGVEGNVPVFLSRNQRQYEPARTSVRTSVRQNQRQRTSVRAKHQTPTTSATRWRYPLLPRPGASAKFDATDNFWLPLSSTTRCSSEASGHPAPSTDAEGFRNFHAHRGNLRVRARRAPEPRA